MGKIPKKYLYVIELPVSAIVFGYFAYLYTADDLGILSFPEMYFSRFCLAYVVIIATGAMLLMYKRSGLSFEVYTYRGLAAAVKGGILYSVLNFGLLFIIFIVVMLFDKWIVELLFSIIAGATLYPVALLALSGSDKQESGFVKAMFGYVFTSILAVMTLVVYVYIFRIIISRTFPSNEAFVIMTGMFAAGFFIWTAAQGCLEGKLQKAVKLFPVLFITFVIIQVIGLYMRIHQYGFTKARYYGMVLIILEVLYEAYYIVRLCRKKGLGGIIFPAAMITATLCLVVPGTNSYSVVTNTHGAVLDKFFAEYSANGEASSELIIKARSSYAAIKKDGGVEGEAYFVKVNQSYSNYKLEKMFNILTRPRSSLNLSTGADIDFDRIETGGYRHFSNTSYSYGKYRYDDDEEKEELDITRVPIKTLYAEEVLAYADLTDLIRKMREIQTDKNADQSDLEKVLEEPIMTDDGKLLIYEISFTVDEFDESKVTKLEVHGYYLYD